MQWEYKVNEAQQPVMSLARVISCSPRVRKAKHIISPHRTNQEAVS